MAGTGIPFFLASFGLWCGYRLVADREIEACCMNLGHA
jgi:hypothetical protein